MESIKRLSIPTEEEKLDIHLKDNEEKISDIPSAECAAKGPYYDSYIIEGVGQSKEESAINFINNLQRFMQNIEYKLLLVRKNVTYDKMTDFYFDKEIHKYAIRICTQVEDNE